MDEKTNISKIRYNGDEEKFFNLGATFDNVFLSDWNRYTLKDLYDYLKKYFDEGVFTMYSKEEPAHENVKIWYDTTHKRDDSYYLENNLTIIEATKDDLKRYVTGKNSIQWTSCYIKITTEEKEKVFNSALSLFDENSDMKLFELPSWEELINSLSSEDEEEKEYENITIDFIINPSTPPVEGI